MEHYMQMAIEEAKLAAEAGEVPVGAVIVASDGAVLARTHNLCETLRRSSAHAEMLAIDRASEVTGRKWLQDCTLYVTLEPCPMCMGAIIHARIKAVVYGAPDPRAGACGSLLDLNAYPMESRPAVTPNVLREECRALLREFFAKKRK